MKNIFNAIFSGKSTCTVNGKTYTGDNITITNNRVIIDGEEQGDIENDKVVNVVINGDCESMRHNSGEVECKNVGSLTSNSGNIKCGDIGGDIKSNSGDVVCEDIQGDVITNSGDVKGTAFYGSVNTRSGDIRV